MSDNLYRDRDARFDTVVGDGKAYWQILSRIADQLPEADRGSHGVTINAQAFGDWCEHHHGFRPIYDSNGGITGRPDIRDPKKYMLCVLKCSG